MWRSEEGKLNINPLSPSLSSLAAAAAIFLPLLYLYKKSGARGNNQNKLGHASSSSPPAQFKIMDQDGAAEIESNGLDRFVWAGHGQVENGR